MNGRKLAILAILGLIAVSGAAIALEMDRPQEWSRQETKISGSWSIVEREGALFVELSAEFKTRSAPDLKIFLSRNALETVTGKNATRDAVLVAPLRSTKGSQRYALPEGIDLSQFKSILLHCEQYSKLWGGSSL